MDESAEINGSSSIQEKDSYALKSVVSSKCEPVLIVVQPPTRPANVNKTDNAASRSYFTANVIAMLLRVNYLRIIVGTKAIHIYQ